MFPYKQSGKKAETLKKKPSILLIKVWTCFFYSVSLFHTDKVLLCSQIKEN